jgi:hypothetical protein
MSVFMPHVLLLQLSVSLVPFQVPFGILELDNEEEEEEEEKEEDLTEWQRPQSDVFLLPLHLRLDVGLHISDLQRE